MDRDFTMLSAVKQEVDVFQENSSQKTTVVYVVGSRANELSSASATVVRNNGKLHELVSSTDWKPAISGVYSSADKHSKTSDNCRRKYEEEKSDMNPAVDPDEFWRLLNGCQDQRDLKPDTKWKLNATLPVWEDTAVSSSFQTSNTGTENNRRADEFSRNGDKASVENKKERKCNKPDQIHSELNAAGQPRQHSCQYCDKRFSLASSAKRHEMVHSGVKPHACAYCEKRFSFKYQLNIHLQRHAGLKQFTCVECDKQFNTKDDLTKHMTMHNGVWRYSCLHCDKLFVRGSSLREHVLRYLGEKPFVCDQCDKQFVAQHELTRHTKRAHTGIKRSDHCSTSKYHCDVRAESKRETFVIGCNSYVREKSERFQAGDVGTGSGRLSAEDGTDENRAAVGLRNERNNSRSDQAHSKLNTNGQSKKYPCQYCGKMFSQSCHARTHEMIHTGFKPYTCGYCEKRFSTKCHLQIHTRRHTGEKPFACIHCDKTFTTYDELKCHAPVHDRERQYECSHCPKRFLYRSNLRVHVQRHSGQKPFSCTRCVKRFATKSDHRKHMKTHYRKMLNKRQRSSDSGSETLHRFEGQLFEEQQHPAGDTKVANGSVVEGHEKQVMIRKKMGNNSTSKLEQHLMTKRNSDPDSLWPSSNIYGISGFPAVASMVQLQLLQCVSESGSRCGSDADSIASKSSADKKPRWRDEQQLGDPDVGKNPNAQCKNDEQAFLPELPSTSLADSTRRQYVSGCYGGGANRNIVDKSFAEMDHAVTENCCDPPNSVNDWETGKSWKGDKKTVLPDTHDEDYADPVAPSIDCENFLNRYSVSSQLLQHSPTHDVKTAYECEECRTMFTDYGQLLWHMFAHAQENHTRQLPLKQEPMDSAEVSIKHERT